MCSYVLYVYYPANGGTSCGAHNLIIENITELNRQALALDAFTLRISGSAQVA